MSSNSVDDFCEKYFPDEALTYIKGMVALLYTFQFRNHAYVDLWAKREDGCLMMLWGIYDGYESIRRYYCEEHGDRNDPGMEENLKGTFTIHEMDTEVIEAAGDRQTARGCWISPGHETCGAPDKSMGTWCWGKYQVEFIKEEGTWKFWKMRLFPTFIAPYDRNWAELKPYDPDEVLEEAPIRVDRRVGGETWNYGSETVYPADEPEPPVPYGIYESPLCLRREMGLFDRIDNRSIIPARSYSKKLSICWRYPLLCLLSSKSVHLRQC